MATALKRRTQPALTTDGSPYPRRWAALAVLSAALTMVIAANTSLVDAIVNITPRTVVANMTRDRMASAPLYDPEVVDEKYLDRVYEHYGYAPYWAAGYLYPSYPFYV
jgi:hypothetical protein